jgi:cytoplasmic iron level regulating protein YaaA (DUF328/UPF0246 family)
MLTLISPAKKLLTPTKPYPNATSNPQFLDKTAELACLMQSKSTTELANMMDISADLAELNFKRYQEFSIHDPKEAQTYPAVFLFQGDVYQSLKAKDWSSSTLDYAQSHLNILSGLYGLLNPLDRIQAYRLEMGVRLNNSCGKSLYDFWRHSITHALNNKLKAQINPILINLASNEYFKAVDEKKLAYPVCTINFYENKNGSLKMVGTLAKKARGAMANFIMNHEVDDLAGVKLFNELGYTYIKDSSSEKNIDFVRA